MSAERKQHPVWEVYDEYRDARYYCKGLSYLLRKARRGARAIDIALAVFAPSSAFTLFFQSEMGSSGPVVAKVLISVAAVLAMVKPLLKLDDAVERRKGAVGRYSLFEHQLRTLIVKITNRGSYDSDLQDDFLVLLQAKEPLTQDTADLHLEHSKAVQFFSEVKRELPSKAFMIPQLSHGKGTTLPSDTKTSNQAGSSTSTRS